MTKLIEDIENYLNQQDYGSVITQTFLLPRNMKIALLSRISTLEARVKELENGIAIVEKIILTNSENVGIELHEILPKNCKELRAIGFRFQSAIRGWYSESSRANEGWRKVEEAESRVKELEAGIKTILSDLKNRREFAYIRRWDMEVALRELLGIKKEEQP